MRNSMLGVLRAWAGGPPITVLKLRPSGRDGLERLEGSRRGRGLIRGEDDDLVVAAGGVVGRGEAAAQGGGDAENLQVVGGYLVAGELRGLGDSGEIQVGLVDGGQGLEGGRVLLPVHEGAAVGAGVGAGEGLRGVADLGDASGVRVRVAGRGGSPRRR
jgi:hypothetical protein